MVRGTLLQSYDFYKALDHPFSKAVYMMFIISEVHPFIDGNGRIARIMMNAEFVSAGHSKIIIPTVYRDDYKCILRTHRSQIEYYSKIRRTGTFFGKHTQPL
jgi:Fic family protein